MERQRTLENTTATAGGHPIDDDVAAAGERLAGVLDEIDQLLDSISPFQAEEMVQQHRQLSAE